MHFCSVALSQKKNTIYKSLMTRCFGGDTFFFFGYGAQFPVKKKEEAF